MAVASGLGELCGCVKIVAGQAAVLRVHFVSVEGHGRWPLSSWSVGQSAAALEQLGRVSLL